MNKLLSLIALAAIGFTCNALDIQNDVDTQKAEQELEELLKELETEPKIFEGLEEESSPVEAANTEDVQPEVTVEEVVSTSGDASSSAE